MSGMSPLHVLEESIKCGGVSVDNIVDCAHTQQHTVWLFDAEGALFAPFAAASSRDDN